MGGEYYWETVPPTATVDPLSLEREEHWRRFDNSVNAVSFGFVATAILISMFLVMAIFERFIRPTSDTSTTPNDLESHNIFNAKLNYPSPKDKACRLNTNPIISMEDGSGWLGILSSHSDDSLCE
ncbi:hypothetical protein E1A91_A13G061500v1 [Gossypium mustelinum]|uniref:Uncharacterized protein isoform X2 n=4 Tax=Gossypium TaxID=3633 RepID=A0ABM2ZF59_GOSHI|nr:uncharacterized protein LOC107894132 isoform X2 [Gossypium hirsutum]KAB2047625.1 hypothetical protein ES319_A13G060300v1 [Gossypium barbadense]TYH90657.1 hypothetical protein ES332_A13G064000v1 [Gossypium tomentosum]TYJ00062.1 hypothetical protein E1A91_A13G061500v1 [Gossypium mustelinum]